MAEVGICVDVDEETFQGHFAARFLFELQAKVLIRGTVVHGFSVLMLP
jgi:hypothetical protein